MGLSSVTCSQTISTLKDEIREQKQRIQNQDSTISTQTLEKEALQEQMDLQRRYTHKQTDTVWHFFTYLVQFSDTDRELFIFYCMKCIGESHISYYL